MGNPRHYYPEHDVEIVLKLLTKSNGPVPYDHVYKLLRTTTNLNKTRIYRALTTIGVTYPTIANTRHISL